MQDDPLWRLRHALAGIGVALLLSVPLAALLGSAVADLIADRYLLRVACYGALLLYVVAGAAALLWRVAAQETQPLTLRRALRWLASLWLWPLLLARKRR